MSGFKRHTGTTISKESRAAVRRYIYHVLPRKRIVSKEQREKHLFTESDLDNLATTLRSTDGLKLNHERIWIQLTFYLLIHAYSGA